MGASRHVLRFRIASTSFLRPLGGAGRLPARRLRLGRGLLRAAHLPGRSHVPHRLVLEPGLGRGHRAFSVRRGGRDESAARACQIGLARDDDSGRRFCGRGRSGMGRGVAALAAFRGRALERRGMGGDGRGHGQCDRVALVRDWAALRPGQGLQRGEHRRRDSLAAMGGLDSAPGLCRGRGGHGSGHACHRRMLEFRGVCKDAAKPGAMAMAARCRHRHRPSRARNKTMLPCWRRPRCGTIEPFLRWPPAWR